MAVGGLLDAARMRMMGPQAQMQQGQQQFPNVPGGMGGMSVPGGVPNGPVGAGQTPGMLAAAGTQGHGANLIPSPLDPLGLFRKNNSPIQDISQALAQGKTITDAQWAQAGFGPGGSQQGSPYNNPMASFMNAPDAQQTPPPMPGGPGGGGAMPPVPNYQGQVNSLQQGMGGPQQPGGIDWSQIAKALGVTGQANVLPGMPQGQPGMQGAAGGGMGGAAGGIDPQMLMKLMGQMGNSQI